jgi:hypothetical protein
VKTNATAAAQKWATAMSGAQAAYTAGVQAVTVPPGQKAAANVQNYIAGVQNKAQEWATNVAAVSLNEWQTQATQKGAPRLGSGATAAQPKFQTFMTALLQFEANALGTLPPRGPKGSNDQRMIAWSHAMQSFKKPAGT